MSKKTSKQTSKNLNGPSPLIRYLLYALVINFIFILAQFFVPFITDIFRGTFLFLLPFFILFLLGIGLMYLTKKELILGRLGRFLILTGFSAAGILAGSVLHNLIYAFFVYFFGKELEEPIFFLLATIVLPLTFVVGVVGSFWELKKIK